MHDHHLIASLVEDLLESQPEGVAAVRIRVGRFHPPEALQQAYEMLTRDTPLEGSRLIVEDPDVEPTCPTCGAVVTLEDVAGHVLLCPSCLRSSRVDSDAAAVIRVARRAGAGTPGPSAPRC
jgi:Zn finger protein HypA/HybF involved in hydrogenase expression